MHKGNWHVLLGRTEAGAAYIGYQPDGKQNANQNGKRKK